MGYRRFWGRVKRSPEDARNEADLVDQLLERQGRRSTCGHTGWREEVDVRDEQVSVRR